MTKTLLLFCLFSAANFYAQVGINTTAPKASLDIPASNTVTPAFNDGLLVPRINAFPLVNPTVEQHSMLVYLNVATLAGSPFGANPVGYYYWSFPLLKWVAIDSAKASSWGLQGNATTVDGTNFIGTTDNIPLNFKVNNQKAGRVNATHTFFGYQAGNSNTENFNVGIGDNALFTNTNGYNNSALGSRTLYKNTVGNENTALGSKALYENINGTGNTAVGFEALYSNTNRGENVAVGYQALRNNTTDSNTAVGHQALMANTSGDSNTSLGRDGLRSNTTGNSNTALGRESLYVNTTGNDNSAFGRNALRNNASGNENTAGGYNSLIGNTTGSGNASYGINSLNHNSSGGANTGIGKEALFNNTTGSNNTALGFAALYSNNVGAQNIGIGAESGRDNTSGNRNIAIGLEASRINTTGSNNTAVGNFALYNNATGSNNTAIGHQADVSGANLTNATAIGNGAVVNQSNKVRIGNNAVTVIEGFVAMSVASDRRYKEEIATMPLGIDFINKLHPVEYVKKSNQDKTKEWGLIAQELEETLKDFNYKNAGIITNDKSKGEYLSVRYTDLIAPIIKSIQELSAANKKAETLQQTVNTQEAKISELNKRLEDLEKKMNLLLEAKK